MENNDTDETSGENAGVNPANLRQGFNVHENRRVQEVNATDPKLNNKAGDKPARKRKRIYKTTPPSQENKE